MLKTLRESPVGRRRWGAASVAAVVVVASVGFGSVADAATPPAAPTAHGTPNAKALVPPPGQRHPGSTRAADQLRVHGRGVPVVSLNPEVYLVFWGTQWANDPAGAAPVLQSFYQGLGGPDDTWSAVLSQYCARPPKAAGLPTATCDAKSKFIQRPATTALRGVWFDNDAPAPAAADFVDLAFEVRDAAQHFGKTTGRLNKNAQYVIASPSGTFPDGFPDFCAYHSWTRFRGFGKLVYTNLPYVPDLPADACTIIPTPNPLDGYLVSASHEYGESVTDFTFARQSGWWSGLDQGTGEIGDLCADFLNDDLEGYITLDTGTFAAEGLFSNAAGACRLTG